jgi:hypothetical protein
MKNKVRSRQTYQITKNIKMPYLNFTPNSKLSLKMYLRIVNYLISKMEARRADSISNLNPK